LVARVARISIAWLIARNVIEARRVISWAAGEHAAADSGWGEAWRLGVWRKEERVG
jgi:hypothetical protein